jgi:ABC-2 type transport system ATP-binding protein
MQESFYGILVDAKQRGRTIFMSSHVLSEVERVCDRIALLRKGELVLLSTMEETRKLATRRVRVFFNEDATFTPLKGVEVVENNPRRWDLTVEGPLGTLLAAITSLPVRDLEVEEPKLEEVILKYYRGGSA